MKTLNLSLHAKNVRMLQYYYPFILHWYKELRIVAKVSKCTLEVTVEHVYIHDTTPLESYMAFIQVHSALI